MKIKLRLQMRPLNRLMLYCALSFVGSFTSPASEIVKPAVPLAAMPFPLSDVRLLAGPFAHAQELDHDYLLELEPDRLLSWYRKEAGLTPKAPVYGGWESTGVAGCVLGHYLSACSEMFQATGDERLRERVNYIVGEMALCQAANSNGYVAAIPGGKKVFSEIQQGIITSKGFDLNGGWVPFYTLHKELAGLRDAYRLCGNTNALAVEIKLADFIDYTLRNVNHDQMQIILACEHGGMNETLADLYADTGEPRYLNLSRRFYHEAVLLPLTKGVDQLNGLHANTQFPKLIGLSRLYELTGDTNDFNAAKFFWERIAHHHSYVTGGDGLDEHLGPPDQLNDRLGPNTTETCNVYNMLKLTSHVFCWRPDADVTDFYERALYDHILSSQNRDDGRVIYNLSLQMGGKKHYETQFNSFTCCVGTGMENHARYGAGIYFHGDNNLYVNLFIASQLDWHDKRIQVRQETDFPNSGQTTLTFQCAQPTRLTLFIRHPYWVENGFAVAVNGQPLETKSVASSYEAVTREWKTGDRVEVTLPRALHLQTMPDNTNRVAIFFGPVVLAGLLGSASDTNTLAGDYVPVLVTGDTAPTNWIETVDEHAMKFRTAGIGRPRDVNLIPFYQITDQNFTVYWDIFTAGQWQKRAAAYETERERQRQLEARTVDFFQPGEMQPERDHDFTGEKARSGDAGGHKWRDAIDGGWLSWDMKVLPGQAQLLVLTYWGGDSGGREFDILVDGKKIATQTLNNNQPGRFFDVKYPLPSAVLENRETITLRVQAHPGATAGGIFGARILRAQ
jgi:DUF1680 family protein